MNNLTETELRILGYIAENKTSKEIAGLLFISHRTVQNHRYNIALKLKLKGSNKLLEFAIQNRELLLKSNPDKEFLDNNKTDHLPNKKVLENKPIWIIGLSILLGITILLLRLEWWPFPISKTNENSGQIKRIAIMPFRLIGPDSSYDYLSDGIMDELITQISKMGGLRVIARSSVMPYKNKSKDLNEIKRTLQVGAILEGSMQKDENRLRINIQLIDTESQENIWGQTFDKDFRDILSVQQEITRQVAMALHVELFLGGLDGGEANIVVNEKLYSAYLKGRFFVNQNTFYGFERAITFYKKALEMDSLYAKAWAGLADVYTWKSNYGFMAPENAYSESRRAAQKAIQIEPELGEAHTALAAVALLYDWDFSLAESEFQTAIMLNPSDVVAHRLYAILKLALGDVERALIHAQVAVKLDPLSLFSNTFQGRNLYFGRKYKEAISQYKKTINIDPGFWLVYSQLGEAYLELGEYNLAIANLRKARELAPDSFISLGRLGYGLAVIGKKKEAQKIMNELIEQSDNGKSLSFQVALIYTALGNNDQAFHWMQVAFDNRHDFMLDLQLDPKLDPLRDDPRFNSFLKKMGFLN